MEILKTFIVVAPLSASVFIAIAGHVDVAIYVVLFSVQFGIAELIGEIRKLKAR